MIVRYKNLLKLLVVLLTNLVMITSCEDYLDKAPEVNIEESDVFNKFASFQGYVEDIYQNTPSITLGRYAEMNWNFGDDVICNSPLLMCSHFDKGDYWFWESPNYSMYWGDINRQIDNDSQGVKGWWHNGWLGIRKSNIVLLKLGELASGTEEELDLLEGQARFFRGFYHFHILRSFGGIAYVDTVFSPSDKIRLPRLSYRETALRVADDLKKAAELLPATWDETTVGKATIGFNEGRITKIAAYGYLGKNLLYAASPLMNGVSTGNYSYDADLCEKAADAFLEVIKLANQGYCRLQSWPDYYKNFYTLKQEPPIGTEVIFNHPIYRINNRYRYGDFTMTYLGGWGYYSSPTENYVEYFGMANGLSIKEPDSGYDLSNPWVNRDPRFYYNILKDGDRLVMKNNADSYAQLYLGGRHRNASNSITGYGYVKYKHVTCNQFDNGWNKYNWECPHMRLADVYLMYAEAVNEAYGPEGSAPGGITAVEAVNIVRNRATLPNVDARYYASKETFREFLREERAVELAFEGHRWYDLRRWYIAHLPQHREKYILEFDKDHTYFKKTLYLTKVFDMKHYWLPFPIDQVALCPEFEQNPGW